MNREIKFRAWDFGNKRMVLGEAIGFTFITNTVFQDGDISATGEILLTEKVKLSELMQYIGLKDKNRKEIYEGDIVKEVCESKIHGQGEVIFEDGCFGRRYGKKGALIFQEEDYEYEVIGNIYSNPELLKDNITKV